MAGAAALWYARRGKRTLLASTNPVHSLSGMLGQDVFGKPTLVEGESDFWAYEIDTKDMKISAINVSGDALTVRLRVEGLRELHVHELLTHGLKSASGRPLDHPNAYYTLNAIPEKE